VLRRRPDGPDQTLTLLSPALRAIPLTPHLEIVATIGCRLRLCLIMKSREDTAGA
jgi:hypothetical protein